MFIVADFVVELTQAACMRCPVVAFTSEPGHCFNNGKLHMGRKQEDAYLPNIMGLYSVTSNPYCEFNFKKIFTKPSGNVTIFIPKS